MTARRDLIRLGGIAAALGLGACGGGGGPPPAPGTGSRNVPIQNFDRIAFIGSANAFQRGNQIKRAALRENWIMEDRGRGLLRGTLNVRSHQAVVDIPYNAQTFSIRYAGSVNLDSDGVTIHRNYNEWVARLQRAIVSAPPG